MGVTKSEIDYYLAFVGRNASRLLQGWLLAFRGGYLGRETLCSRSGKTRDPWPDLLAAINKFSSITNMP